MVFFIISWFIHSYSKRFINSNSKNLVSFVQRHGLYLAILLVVDDHSHGAGKIFFMIKCVWV